MRQEKLGKRHRRTIREVVYLNAVTSQGISHMLELYPRVESRSRLMETAIEWYLICAKQYGLNANWHPPIPGLTEGALPNVSSSACQPPQNMSSIRSSR